MVWSCLQNAQILLFLWQQLISSAPHTNTKYTSSNWIYGWKNDVQTSWRHNLYKNGRARTTVHGLLYMYTVVHTCNVQMEHVHQLYNCNVHVYSTVSNLAFHFVSVKLFHLRHSGFYPNLFGLITQFQTILCFRPYYVSDFSDHLKEVRPSYI